MIENDKKKPKNQNPSDLFSRGIYAQKASRKYSA
jgi:hypothetical protein